MKSILFLVAGGRSSKGHHLLLRQSVRHMGGGPRTFPGGINKWQWKRLHEKKAKEKEGKLLHQEKQLYQARIRSDIRSKLSQPIQKPDPNHNYSPISPQQHIKSLADRFMKECADDLWNEADGPTQQSTTTTTTTDSSSSGNSKPVVANLFANSGNEGFGYFANLSKSRCYSSVCATSTNKFSKGEAFCNFSTWSNCYDSVGGTSMFARNGGVGNLGNWLRCRNYCVGVGASSGFLGYEAFRNLSRGSSYRGCCSVGISRRFLENGGFGDLGGGLKCRHFSVGGGVVRKRRSRYSFRKNDDSSSNESDGDDEMANNLARRNFRLGADREDDEEEEMGGRGNGKKKMMSSAALGNYDKKIKRRIPLQFVENEDDLSQHVEVIRKEVSKRNMEDDGVNGDEETMLIEKRFDECNVSPLTVKALTSAGYVQMTRVQEATLSAYLEEKDALVKAKTGTGKSVAFLLPAIETVLRASSSKSLRVSPIYVLILCPTRELASQIAAGANVLLKFHEGIGVQTLVGGTRFKVDQKRLESDPCQIIVATPGRLLDHIENKSGFSTRLMGLNMLILDEADHLLDLGFRKDMEKIVDCLPRQRQSLLFSATIPKEVCRISQLVLKREHAYVDTVGMGCVETPIKVIVFCTTAMMTSLMFSLFRDLKFNVRELHSRKPQLYRTRISDEFRESKRLILITSDVSSRGMNYPDVTLVLQVGIPSDREQYIHRLGRTGREGKAGESILLIAPWEKYFLDEIKDLPLEKLSLPRLNPEMTEKVVDSMAKIDTSIKEAAYHAWLGYYNSNGDIGRDKTTLVELANKFCESIGLQKPPSLFRKTALKMGLKDIAGIRIRK